MSIRRTIAATSAVALAVAVAAVPAGAATTPSPTPSHAAGLTIILENTMVSAFAQPAYQHHTSDLEFAVAPQPSHGIIGILIGL